MQRSIVIVQATGILLGTSESFRMQSCNIRNLQSCKLYSKSAVSKGGAKMREWKMEEQRPGVERAGVNRMERQPEIVLREPKVTSLDLSLFS